LAHGAEWVKEGGFGVGGVAYLKRKSGGLLALVAALWLGLSAAGAVPAAPVPATRAPAPAAPPAPRPAIWLLSDDDTQIYLFGTIHILPPDLHWRSSELDRVVAEADELVLEIAETPDGEEGDELGALMLLGKDVPITHRVSPERRAGLEAMVAAAGMPIETFDSMQTWAVAVALAAMAVAQEYAGDSGVAPEDLTGVEEVLRADFRARNRPVSGVETTAQQLGIFSRMPLHVQRTMLESMVDAYLAGDTGIMDPGEDGWVRGDTDGIAAEMQQMPPELFVPLLVTRNRAWTQYLIARLERPGKVLFAVGAGHLAGDASVQSMLAARGFRVRRVN